MDLHFPLFELWHTGKAEQKVACCVSHTCCFFWSLSERMDHGFGWFFWCAVLLVGQLELHRAGLEETQKYMFPGGHIL